MPGVYDTNLVLLRETKLKSGWHDQATTAAISCNLNSLHTTRTQGYQRESSEATKYHEVYLAGAAWHVHMVPDCGVRAVST